MLNAGRCVEGGAIDAEDGDAAMEAGLGVGAADLRDLGGVCPITNRDQRSSLDRYLNLKIARG